MAIHPQIIIRNFSKEKHETDTFGKWPHIKLVKH